MEYHTNPETPRNLINLINENKRETLQDDINLAEVFVVEIPKTEELNSLMISNEYGTLSWDFSAEDSKEIIDFIKIFAASRHMTWKKARSLQSKNKFTASEDLFKNE